MPQFVPEDIEEIYTLRLMIDSMAARLAATRATAESFAALEENLAATKALKTIQEASRLDAEFHDLIVCTRAAPRAGLTPIEGHSAAPATAVDEFERAADQGVLKQRVLGEQVVSRREHACVANHEPR